MFGSEFFQDLPNKPRLFRKDHDDIFGALFVPGCSIESSMNDIEHSLFSSLAVVQWVLVKPF